MSVSGKHVVVTGKIAGESRRTAEAKLQDAGATVQSSVSSTTEVLVTGDAVGKTKLEAAQARGITILPWAAVELNGSGPKPPPATNGSGARKRPVTAEHAEVRTIAPMLAKAAEHVPGDAGWLFEIKWDGYRCVATVADGKVAMQSRSGKTDFAIHLHEIAAELGQLPDCVLDGELVVLDDDGNSSFEAMGTGTTRFIVFDILATEGFDVRGAQLLERRAMLEGLLGATSIGSASLIAVAPAWDDGEKLLAFASEQGIEGIVAKRKSSRYVEGGRSGAWLKIKLRCEQEFVVAGYTPGEGARSGMIGALLLAVYEGDELDLVFVGKCGTGRVTDAQWRELQGQLKPGLPGEAIRIPDGSLSGPELKSVTWVEPDTVVQVAFQRWTKDGRLWHPSYLGVREDKAAGDVVREP